MAIRGSIILSRELLDEYIDARGLDQITVDDKVRWRHNCGTEWEATVNDRRHGKGCPACGFVDRSVGGARTEKVPVSWRQDDSFTVVASEFSDLYNR